ncbi:MAG: ribosome biogenesis GTP-binding protein YihA/YsxC [Anaplasmataceae bacterium]|nr:ribosome biogenesis GTP-binding protein YihA/YsxC [Anaplasmataceae bacterium]
MFTNGDAKLLFVASQLDQIPPYNLAKKEVIVIGSSNVGKSSLINRLCNRKKLAYTSKTPGKTKQIIFFEVSPKIILVDLPGYGYAKVSKKEQSDWGILIEQYLKSRRKKEYPYYVLSLIDGKTGIKKSDYSALDWLISHNIINKSNATFIITKSEKIKKDQLDLISEELAKITDTNPIISSAYDNTGIKEIRGFLNNIL